MATPEGRVKVKVKAILAARGKELKQFWPVQNGMGSATIDCHVCYAGSYLVIETKAPGEKATPRQESTLSEYRQAGGYNLVIDGSNYEVLESILDEMHHLSERV